MAVQTTDKPDVPDYSITPEKEPSDRLRQIRNRFAVLQAAWSNIHAKAREDDRFVAGYQWKDDILREREDDGRPALTFNLLERYVTHITNNIRANWPEPKVVPVETDKFNKQRFENVAGTKDYSQAEVLNGIIRNIESISKADHAYETAAEHSTRHGFGFFRIITQYSNDDSFDQDILIKRVKNSYSCYIDLGGEEADYSDAMDAFVFSSMQLPIFKAKYPKVQYTQIDKSTAAGFYDGWYDSDSIRVAEYYYIEHIEDRVLLLSDGTTVYESEVKDILDELEEDEGIVSVKKRKVRRPQCKWLKMTADAVLEGPIDIPTRYIPLLLVAGKEYIVDGEYELHGAIRQAKDAQKSYNYNRTAATEKQSLDPKAPYIGTEEQFADHPEWDNANRKNLPYLPYTHQENVPPPSRNYPSGAGQAEMMNAQMDKQDIREIVGLPEASTGDTSNEISGKAVRARQTAGNVASFVFPDNLKRTVEHGTRILIDMIPRVYTAEKIQRIELQDGTEDFVQINRVVQDEETGKDVIVHDIAMGKFDVRYSSGPSYETQRQEATDSMMELMRILSPQKADMIAHMIVKHMDWPGADDVYALMRKTLPDELKSEDEKAADLPAGYIVGPDGTPVNEETGEPLPPPQPTAEQQLAAKQAEAETKKADAVIAKADADTAKAAADKAEAEAKMAEITAKIGQEGTRDVDQGAVQGALIARMEELLESHAEEVDEKIVQASVDILKRVKLAQSRQPKKQEA